MHHHIKTHGRKTKLITAYTALATVALGVVAFDFVNPLRQRILIADFSAQELTVSPSVSMPAVVWQTAKPVTVVAALPNAKIAVESRPEHRVTVASYTAPRPAM